tara:strand:+ start:1202 stop:1390 length:189 start_codon:yes stop_codon:yes gene_type:complete
MRKKSRKNSKVSFVIKTAEKKKEKDNEAIILNEFTMDNNVKIRVKNDKYSKVNDLDEISSCE